MNAPPARTYASYPMRHTRIWLLRDLRAGLLFIIPPAIAYFLTLQHGVGWWDSGELIAAAKTLSIAHRPGFPLYVLGGHVLYGWLSDPRWAANALSAACALAALLFIWRAFQIMAGERKFGALWIGAGGWLMAWAPLYWRQAIRAEVYAPTYAVLALAFLLAVAAQHAPDPRTATRRFLIVAYLAGLAFCLHSALAVTVWPLLAVLFVTGNFRPSLRQSLGAAIALAAGLSVYLYVPLRAGHAYYVWGDPSNLAGLITYLTASDSYGVIAQEAGGTLNRVGELLGVVWNNSSGWLATLGTTGLIIGAFRKRPGSRLPWVMAISGTAIAATVVSHVIADNFDLQAYLFPLLWAAWWGWAMLNPLAWLSQSHPSARRIGTAVTVALLAFVSIIAGAQGTRAVMPARLGMADLWGGALLSSAMPGDLIVVQDANTDFLMRGIQACTPGRHNIAVLNTALAPAHWYRTWWSTRYIPGGTAIAIQSPTWPRDVARWWQKNQGQVFVDYGTPGWQAGELMTAGWLGCWAQAARTASEVPVFELPGADADPDWVRTAVWYYYRLGNYYAERGLYARAADSWTEGLRWAPNEPTLLRMLAGIPDGHPAVTGRKADG